MITLCLSYLLVISVAGVRTMCGRGRAVGGPRYLNFVRAACEVGPTRYAGGIACRRVTVRGRYYSNSNSKS